MSITRRHLLALMGATTLLPTALLAHAQGPQAPPGAARWNDAIAAFEAKDRTSPPPEGAVLFIGSSSIRKWSTLSRDMAPIAVLNRGFGGSHIPHCTWFAPRIVLPYKPRAIVLYAGDNDVAWGASAEKVLADFKAFLDAFKPHLDVPLVFLSIKPSPLRWKHWPEMQRANQLIRAFIETRDDLSYVDVAAPLLDDQGQARSEFFASDRLHLSPAGYAAWTAVVRPAVERLVPEGAAPPR